MWTTLKYRTSTRRYRQDTNLCGIYPLDFELEFFSVEDTYHTLDYLLLCKKNGIVLREKFQFCQDVVQFGGLQITSSGVTSYDNLVNTTSSFLTPPPQNGPRCCWWLPYNPSMGPDMQSMWQAKPLWDDLPAEGRGETKCFAMHWGHRSCHGCPRGTQFSTQWLEPIN